MFCLVLYFSYLKRPCVFSKQQQQQQQQKADCNIKFCSLFMFVIRIRYFAVYNLSVFFVDFVSSTSRFPPQYLET
jgi:hypothetical protein